jgi:hypothetical protein
VRYSKSDIGGRSKKTNERKKKQQQRLAGSVVLGNSGKLCFPAPYNEVERVSLRGVAGKECFEELHETRDAALLLPACGRQEEGEEATILRWHASGVSL